MNQVLVDTNVVLDLLAEREPFVKEAAILFSLADQNKIELSITALSFANTYYILAKHLGSSKAREILSRFKVLVKTLAIDDKVIELALSDNEFKDFEDAIQHYCALENECSVIITRNQKDFKNSKIPVLSPKQFLSK